MRFTLSFSLFLICVAAKADFYPRNYNADVTHYEFRLQLSDESNLIMGIARVFVTFKKDTSAFSLDLVKMGEDGQGMKITSLVVNADADWIHTEQNKIMFSSADSFKKDQNLVIEIEYEGIPIDGLVIAQNKYGDRTFFGDNYPTRARNWIPCVDHLYEKASVEWIVEAPAHYQVIGNGIRIEESVLSEKVKLTRWLEETPISPKVMVIGVARFAVNLSGSVDGIPVEAWVYPQNREEGFYDYELAIRPLTYFIENVGPYSYQKLANVQSKTRYGGMENASNIFYFENSVTGNRTIEALVAHEVAHQWFGNSASENDWHHVWLSEGFATYFTHLYMENYYGRENMNDRMRKDEAKIISYFRQNPTPVVDTTITDYNKILNTNTYQKGGWVLHMLRHKVGDDVFWRSINKYYLTFQNGNAMTEDLQEIFEAESQMDLDIFFQQWLYGVGQPRLAIDWSVKKASLNIAVQQKQSGTFVFPIEFEIIFEDGQKELVAFDVKNVNENFTVEIDQKVSDVVVDPLEWLLFESNSK